MILHSHSGTQSQALHMVSHLLGECIQALQQCCDSEGSSRAKSSALTKAKQVFSLDCLSLCLRGAQALYVPYLSPGLRSVLPERKKKSVRRVTPLLRPTARELVEQLRGVTHPLAELADTYSSADADEETASSTASTRAFWRWGPGGVGVEQDPTGELTRPGCGISKEGGLGTSIWKSLC